MKDGGNIPVSSSWFTKPNIEVSGWLYQPKTHFTHIIYQPFSRVSPPSFTLYGYDINLIGYLTVPFLVLSNSICVFILSSIWYFEPIKWNMCYGIKIKHIFLKSLRQPDVWIKVKDVETRSRCWLLKPQIIHLNANNWTGSILDSKNLSI